MNTSDTRRHPRRMLSSGFTLAVIIGGIIGLGILRTPGEVAAVVSDPLIFVSLWLLGALFQAVAEIDAAAYAALMVAISWPVYRLLVRSGST